MYTGLSKKQVKGVKLSQSEGTSASPVGITHTVTVNNDQTWSVYVHGKELEPTSCEVLKMYLVKLSPGAVSDLLNSRVVISAFVCGEP